MSPTKYKSKINLNPSQASGCPLTTLNLSCCIKITDKSIYMISEYCKQIKKIDITHCEQVTDKSIDNLSRSLRFL